MTENPNMQEPIQQEPQASAGTEKTENMVPQPRFSEVVNERNLLRAEIEQLKQQRQLEEEADLAKKQEWQTLAEQRLAKIQELETYQQQAESYRQQIEAYNQADIERIPEEKRHLVPDFGDPVKLREYLNKALPDLIETPKPKPPKLDGGSGSGSSENSATALTANVESVMDIASRYTGLTLKPERIAQRYRNPQKPTDLENKDQTQ